MFNKTDLLDNSIVQFCKTVRNESRKHNIKEPIISDIILGSFLKNFKSTLTEMLKGATAKINGAINDRTIDAFARYTIKNLPLILFSEGIINIPDIINVVREKIFGSLSEALNLCQQDLDKFINDNTAEQIKNPRYTPTTMERITNFFRPQKRSRCEQHETSNKKTHPETPQPEQTQLSPGGVSDRTSFADKVSNERNDQSNQR